MVSEQARAAWDAITSGDFTRARQIAETALTSTTDPIARLELYDMLGSAAQIAGDIGEAERAARAAVDESMAAFGPLHPLTGSSQMSLAEFLEQEGRIDEAIATLESIACDSDHDRITRTVEIARLDPRRAPEAIALIDRSLQGDLHPEYRRALELLRDATPIRVS
jgi:hypothetical protein